MKYVLLIAAIALLLWMIFGRSKRQDAVQRKADKAQNAPKADAEGRPVAIVACAHCGVHLPAPDAPHDADGRPYCTEAHRLAGPRPPR